MTWLCKNKENWCEMVNEWKIWPKELKLIYNKMNKLTNKLMQIKLTKAYLNKICWVGSEANKNSLPCNYTVLKRSVAKF